jgi:hypothetical protein
LFLVLMRRAWRGRVRTDALFAASEPPAIAAAARVVGEGLVQHSGRVGELMQIEIAAEVQLGEDRPDPGQRDPRTESRRWSAVSACPIG